MTEQRRAGRPVGTGKPLTEEHRANLRKALSSSKAHQRANEQRRATQQGSYLPHWKSSRKFTRSEVKRQNRIASALEGTDCRSCGAALELTMLRGDNIGTARCKREHAPHKFRWSWNRGKLEVTPS